jgi:hypothetical protein
MTSLTIKIPDFTMPSLADAPVVGALPARAASRLGFQGDVRLVAKEGATLIWGEGGDIIAARGAPAGALASLASGGSMIGSVERAAPPPPPEPLPMPEAQPEMLSSLTPAVSIVPDSSEDPASFIARICDAVKLRDWVFSQGLSTPHAQAWARFAAALGWEIPPAEAEPSVPEEGANNG